ncbi:MAG: hypothetical protein HY318_14710 [Armatimonadetes bacterium]|nr:hypothetical protein [Armatimonadota bacterium]
MLKTTLLMLIALSATALSCPSAEIVIDDFSYPDSQAAQAAWVPMSAALAPELVTMKGRHSLRLPCRFREDTVRAAWDKQVHIDLSACSHFTLRFKVDDLSTLRMLSLYFNSGGDGWFANLWLPMRATTQWQTIVVPRGSFGCEGSCPGWNDVRTIRISVWQARPGEASFAIADFRAEQSEGPENLLPNSSFEICTTEKLPDFWGSGHWGLCAPRWIVDTEAWRRRWGVVEGVSHSGKRSLRIVGSAEPDDLKAVANWVGVEAGKPYTLSAWLRSDTADLPVELELGGAGNERLKVGKEWQRYSVTGVPTESRITCTIRPAAEGTVWIDDAQLEMGAAASDFRVSPLDRALTGTAVHHARPRVPAYEVAPGPKSVEVKIDEHRRFLVNGKPFIPFATGWEIQPTPEILRDTGLAGFNSICSWATARPAKEVRQLLDVASKNGLFVILWIHPSVNAGLLRQWVTELRDHPALIAWYVFDEPSTITPEIREMYDLVRELDPGRPAYINYVTYSSDQLGDIASLDDYPIPNNTPAAIAGDAETLERFASKAGKPSWIWLQDMGNAYYVSREPTGAEAEAMTYLALIHGVRGIKFFAQKPRSGELWNHLGYLAREVRTLTPILYSLEQSPSSTVAPPAIHHVVKRFEGALYMVAVNATAEPVTATFTVPPSTGKASVLFENRTVRVVKGVMRDRFEGYQRHVYRLGK